MTTKTKSATVTKSGKTVINVPNPDTLPVYSKAYIGATIAWKASTPSYPKFQLNFGESNPFNGRKNAKFSGETGQPLALVAKNAGDFEYKITHIKQDGSKCHTGPFAIRVQIGPKRCPPFC
ncbi:MAG TPA: hypothetical protein VK729_03445 [Silvibacterium sp.]|jgi:hypothetical protein|nr:hypothetical protein [Silvibacterium sp.]